MIDTLMMAYTVEMISVERVLTCVQKYSPFFPEEDFPYDAEEAVTTWINKVRFWTQCFKLFLICDFCPLKSQIIIKVVILNYITW